jgi:branched-chain amino acid transport system permease protein
LLFLIQVLNGVQFGLLLFLLAAGLTLILGIMNFVNLAHGSLFMVGAYIASEVSLKGGSFVAALMVSIAAVALLGIFLDRIIFQKLYLRDHLDQVLATFGLVLIANEGVRFIWGPSPRQLAAPDLLSGPIEILGIAYPAYRLAIILASLAVALFLYILINRTRVGILIRAGASNPQMIAALGINVDLLKTGVIALGAGLAALAGVMAGPISAVQSGMGEPILILAMVVIVIGGIGSIRGAFYAALFVGVIDTLGRVYIPMLLREVMERSLAQPAGAAIASIAIYMLLAIVLAVRPQGLFPVRHG